MALSKKKGEIFFVNIMSKIYVKIKKCNEWNSTQQTVRNGNSRKKSESTIENIGIISAVTEKMRIEKRNTYMFFSDAVKCLYKLRLQDYIIELAKLGHIKIDLEILYNLNHQNSK